MTRALRQRAGAVAAAQTIVTFVCPVASARVAELRALLAVIGGDAAGNAVLPLGRLTSLHFASFVLHDDATFGTRLIFEANFDHSFERFLDDVGANVASGIARILQHCTDYANTEADERDTVTRYLRTHAVFPWAGFVGNVGRSVAQIGEEAALRDKLESVADELLRASTAGDAAAIDTAVRRTIAADGRLRELTRAAPRVRLRERLVPKLELGLAAALALAVAIMCAPALLVFIVLLRRAERRDTVRSQPVPRRHLQALLANEDPGPDCVMNHFANIAPVKAGPLRAFTLRVVLRAIDLLAHAVYTNGELGDIASIHFAHWSLIDGGRNLLFLSNYDGSWESYLGDFIDRASAGLTAVWSNTTEFPRTRFLIMGGARDERGFKTIARARQVPTLVWYRAYDGLSVADIDRNSAIRRALAAPAGRAYLGLL